MPDYIIKVTETNTHHAIITADNPEQAIELAQEHEINGNNWEFKDCELDYEVLNQL